MNRISKSAVLLGSLAVTGLLVGATVQDKPDKKEQVKHEAAFASPFSGLYK